MLQSLIHLKSLEMAHTGPDFVSTHAMLPEPSGYTTSSFTLKGQRLWATNSVAVHVWCDKVCGFYQTSWIRWSLGVAEQKQSCTLFIYTTSTQRNRDFFFSAQKIHNRWASPAPSEPFVAPCSPSGKFNCRILGTKSGRVVIQVLKRAGKWTEKTVCCMAFSWWVCHPPAGIDDGM